MSGIKGANAGEKCGRYVHGETKTRLHKIWESMIARCEYEKHPYFRTMVAEALLYAQSGTIILLSEIGP